MHIRDIKINSGSSIHIKSSKEDSPKSKSKRLAEITAIADIWVFRSARADEIAVTPPPVVPDGNAIPAAAQVPPVGPPEIRAPEAKKVEE